MIINELSVFEGNTLVTSFLFKSRTLIYSNDNSKGKTTLIRFLLHGLLFNVSSTSRVRFGDYKTVLKMTQDNGNNLIIERNDKIGKIIYCASNECEFFDLTKKESRIDALSIIFGISNVEIIENLLGCFYIDQDIGWGIINRGLIANPSNSFNIVNFIASIILPKKLSELKLEIKRIDKEIAKYTAIKDIFLYKEQLSLDSGDVPNNNFNELYLKKARIESEIESETKVLSVLERSLKSDESFKELIQRMNLLITHNGDSFPLRIENISGFAEKSDMLKSKYIITMNRLSYLKKEKEELKLKISSFSPLKIDTISDDFISRIPSADNFDQVDLDKIINDLRIEKQTISKRITGIAKDDNILQITLSNLIIKFSKELQVYDDYVKHTKGLLFYRENSQWSGAILNKIALAYRCAYCKIIEMYFKIKLPLIIDSPGVSEMSNSNINLISNLLFNNFCDNQIVISSIYDSLKSNSKFNKIIALDNLLFDYKEKER